MDKIQKKEFVKKIKETLSGIGLLVITHYNGLKTSETDELRLKLREVGGAFQVTKNSLMQLVLKENKNKELKVLFTGPVAIMYSKDEVSAAKIAVNFFKEHDKNYLMCVICRRGPMISRCSARGWPKGPQMSTIIHFSQTYIKNHPKRPLDGRDRVI